MFTPFGRDFCSAQHSTSKLDSAFAYRKKSTINRRPSGFDLLPTDEKSRRDDITQAGVSTPANGKQTPEPRRGDRENSVGVTSVSSVERFRRSRELIKKEEKKSFKSVNQRSLSLWR